MGNPLFRCAAALLAAIPTAACAGSFVLADDTLDLAVGQYSSICFSVDVAQQDSTRIAGYLSVFPDTLYVEILLFHRDDFGRWAESLPDVDTLFYERRGSGPVSIPIDGFGDMALVVSNRGNYDGAEVQAGLDLTFAGDGVPYNPLITGSRLVLGMISAGAALALILGIAVRASGRRRRRAAASRG